MPFGEKETDAWRFPAPAPQQPPEGQEGESNGQEDPGPG